VILRPFRSKLNRSLCSLHPVSLISHSADVTEVQDDTPISLPGCLPIRSAPRRRPRLCTGIAANGVWYTGWNAEIKYFSPVLQPQVGHATTSTTASSPQTPLPASTSATNRQAYATATAGRVTGWGELYLEVNEC